MNQASTTPDAIPEFDEARFLSLFSRITAVMRSYDPNDAEDIAADAINKCIPHLRAGKVLEDAYFLRCAKNLYIDRHRGLKNQVYLQSLPDPQHETLAYAVPRGIEDEIDAGERDQLLAQMNDAQRELVLLIEQGHGITEASALLGITPDAAKKKMQRIRLRTSALIADDLPRYIATPSPPFIPAPPVEAAVAEVETGEMSAEHLPPRQREIIRLLDEQHLTRGQVALRMGLQRASVYAMERQARQRMRDGSPRRPTIRTGDISPRRRELLGFLAQGMTDIEIGTAMSISRDTVKNQLQMLTKTLGVKNRTQAVVEAIRRGLVTV